ncbi:MAG TPA: oligosaccharide flippase family protein [Thermoanaerobaculia bacterium]|nr:oligosaccharide flippase family protein [Thermoanaerobaculia bacterium]
MSETRYLRRGAWLLGAVTVGGFATDYLFNLGLARFLDPHGYGDFKVAFSFAFFFGMAVLLGGDRAAPMVLAPSIERGERRRVWAYLRFYLGNAMLLSVGLAAVVWTASWLHVGSSDAEHHHALAWAVLVVPLNAVAAMVSRTLQSAQRPALAVLPWRIALPLLQLVLLAVWVAWRGSVEVLEAIGIATVVTLFLTLLQWAWVRRLKLVEVVADPDRRRSRDWLASSLPMMGSFLVALALNQSDVYFLEMLGDEAEVGKYAAAATAAHLVLLVQTTVIGLVAPIAKRAIDQGGDDERATYRRSQGLLVKLAIPVAVLLALAADPVLALFGPEYRAAHTVLLFLTLGNLTWALAAVPSLWLQYRGRAHSVLAISIATLIVDSALNLVLIPRYGMAGAAAGTAFTLSAAALAAILVRRRAA